MPAFFGISPGETRSAEAIRIEVRADGEAVWMHGKWLDLGPDHAVAVFAGGASFQRPDGKVLTLGDFPAWVVRGKGKRPMIAAMFNVGQFRGGVVRLGEIEYPVPDAALQAAQAPERGEIPPPL